MKIALKKITLVNFMAYGEKTIDFGNIVGIKGKNGIGKSSILTAYMWLLHNCDYELRDNPKVRREVNGVPVADMDTSVEIVINVDGKEVTMKKVQKRKFGKDGVSYSDDNSYFINDVPKTMRDFNDYLDIDMKSLKLCGNVNAFISQSSKEMREFLFGTVGDVLDYDISSRHEDLEPLTLALRDYTLEEIVAMNKASKARVNKEIPILEGQIKEKERDCTVTVDVAEYELLANSLREKIDIAEKTLKDADKMNEAYQAQADGIMELKFKASDMLRKANEVLQNAKQSVAKDIQQAKGDLIAMQIEYDKANAEMAEKIRLVQIGEAEREVLGQRWTEVSSREYPEYVEVPAFDKTTLVCPTCKQDLPDDVKAQRITQYEADKEAQKRSYLAKKTIFEQNKKVELEEITSQGTLRAEEIKKIKEEIAECELAFSDLLEKIERQKELVKQLEAQYEGMPSVANMDDCEEYRDLQVQIIAKEAALDGCSTFSQKREQIQEEMKVLRHQLLEAEKEIAKADTSKDEERLEDLRRERINLEQAKADCEQMLFLADELDRYKNEYLSDSINEKFQVVNWQLFEFNKSGGYKNVCIPTMDGKSLMDISSNKGNKILGKLDICNSVQKIIGVSCPVFLDDAESLDNRNVKKLLEMMDCQVILLKVTDDDLKVEEI